MRKWRLGALLTILLCTLAFTACAQESTALPPEVASLCEAIYPEHKVSVYSGWEKDGQGEYALVLSKDSNHLLCIAEKEAKDTEYRLTIANDKALRSGEQLPSLYMADGSDSLYYQYDGEQYRLSYHAAKGDAGAWEHIYLIREDILNHEQFTVTVKEDLLLISGLQTDRDGKMNRQYQYTPVPVPWLKEYLSLDRFDIAKFPVDTYEALSSGGMQAAADLLLPQGVTVLDGCTTPAALFMLVSGQDGEKRLYICEWTEASGFHVTQSSVLPKNASIDTIHAWNNIYVQWTDEEEEIHYSFSLHHDGKWSADVVMARHVLTIGENYVAEPETDQICYGTFPTMDIRTVTWERLPNTFEEAVSMMDTSGWARVVSDDPQKRLHLRVAPNKDAKSLGKYYSGTAVQVLDDQGEWAHVSVYGIEGYMMKEFLAFGEEMLRVPAYYPQLVIRPELWADGVKVYVQPNERADITRIKNESGGYSTTIIGVAGDDWFHVIFDNIDVIGYVKQECFYPGNG